MNAQKRNVSLRLLDSLVSSHAKRNRICYHTENGQKDFNIYISYRDWLDSYRKTNFDPFRRGHRFFFDGSIERPDWKKKLQRLRTRRTDLTKKIERRGGAEINPVLVDKLEQLNARIADLLSCETTIGQLNFFRWAIDNDVFEWAQKNRDTLEKRLDFSKDSKSAERANKMAQHIKKKKTGDRTSSQIPDFGFVCVQRNDVFKIVQHKADKMFD